MIDVSKMTRWCTTTRTWVQKSARILQYYNGKATMSEQRWLIGYEAEQLLWVLLDESEVLVGLLHKDFSNDEYLLRDIERKSKLIARLIRDRRLAAMMDDTNGRTVEEAATFTAKAKELRAS